MRRRDLEFAQPGLYIVDSDEPGNPDGIVLQGPYPRTDEGRRVAQTYLDRYRAMTKRNAVVSEVTDVVLPGRG